MHYQTNDNWSAVKNNGPYSPYRRVTSTVAAQYTALSVTTLHIKLVKNWQQIKNVIASLTSDYNTNSQVYTQIKEKQPAQFHAFLPNSYCTVSKLSKQTVHALKISEEQPTVSSCLLRCERAGKGHTLFSMRAHRSQIALTTAASAKWMTPFSGPSCQHSNISLFETWLSCVKQQ